MAKKLIALFVAAMMLVGLVPAAAFARTEQPAPSDTLVWDFESDPEEQGFTMLDADGDGHNWHWLVTESTYEYHHEGTGLMKSESYLSGVALTPDNWLMTPAFTGSSISFWANPRSGTYSAEYLGVYVSTDGGENWGSELFGLTLPEDVTPTEYTVDLGDYAGQEIRVAFRHYDCSDQYALMLDYITVETGSEEPPADPYAIHAIDVSGFIAPVEGMTGAELIAGLTVPEDANYAIASVEAYDNTDGAALEEDTVLIAGHVYQVGCMVEPEGDYYFWDTAELTADGGGTELDETFSGVVSANEAWIVAVEMTCTEAETPVVTLDEALNAPGGELHFETEGDYPWTVVSEDGRDYAKSGNAGVASSASSVTAGVTVEAGDVLSFEFKAWGEGTGGEIGVTTIWDKCIFAVDGETVLMLGAHQNEEWETFEYAFEAAGDHTLTWSYTKDSSVDKPGDCFSVDNVCLTHGEEPEPVIREVWVDGWGTPEEGIAGIDHVFLTVPDGAPYYIIYGGWRDETDQQQMWSEDQVFIAGHEYSEGCQIWAEEGYTFAADCVFHTNDGDDILDAQWCYVDELDDYICYMNSIPVVCEAEGPQPGTISEIHVDGIEFPPLAGQNADDHLDITVQDGEPYTIEYARWFDEDNIAAFHDAFVLGGHYSVNISVGLPDGYVFADEVTVYINGRTDLASEYYFNYGSSYSFYTIPFECVEEAEPEPITSVNVNGFITPVAGETAEEFLSLYLDEGVHYQIAEIEGYDIFGDDLALVTPETVFTPGHSYMVGCTVTADYGWYFADDCELLANGGTELLDPELSGVYAEGIAGVTSILMTCAEDDPFAIREVDINGFDVPEWGANPDYEVEFPEDAHYTLDLILWSGYDGEFNFIDLDPEDVFDDPNMTYYAEIMIVPAEGYTFAEDCVVRINGSEELVDFFFNDVTDLDIATVNFTVTEPGEPELIPIHEVWVDGWGTPEEGAAGIDHVFLTVSDDAPYYIIYGGWRDETDQQQMWSEEHVFIAGHEYSEGCQIWAEEGYCFAEDCVFHTNDGDDILDAEWCYVDELDNYICYMNSIPVVCEEAAGGLLGDVDGNGTVNVADAILMLRYSMGLIEFDEGMLARGDVYGDGSYNVPAAILIMRHAMGLIDHFPAEE
ncbi:MAG: choice-of-anchor J domain-containing protein [Clostridia bacterium]|nr:choice-of-anchor J domain-containing protein [Clostridia bacterium]